MTSLFSVTNLSHLQEGLMIRLIVYQTLSLGDSFSVRIREEFKIYKPNSSVRILASIF